MDQAPCVQYFTQISHVDATASSIGGDTGYWKLRLYPTSILLYCTLLLTRYGVNAPRPLERAPIRRCENLRRFLAEAENESDHTAVRIRFHRDCRSVDGYTFT